MATVVTPSARAERRQAGPTMSQILVPGTATDERLSAVVMELPDGWDGPPPHVHRRVDHLWYVVAGAVEFTVDGNTVESGPGDGLFVPAGTPHAFTPRTAARVLQVDTPLALDGYFRDLSATFGDAAAPEPAAVGAVMRRHDTWPVTD